MADKLQERIEALVAEINRMTLAYWEEEKLKISAPTYQVEYASAKWAKIWRYEMQPKRREDDEEETDAEPELVLTRTSIYAFVALQDGLDNKALGMVNAGDIHKPASYKAPAKHARGSVFSDDFGRCLGIHGIHYLK